jgi:hypothetical protein
MTTLRQILELTWTITDIIADLREANGQLIKTYKLGKGHNEETATIYEKSAINRGELELMDISINHHGRPTRGGQSEMRWGTDFKAIPDFLLDAEVTFFRQSSEHYLSVDLTPIQMTLNV